MINTPYDYIPQGWQCPQCKKIHAPQVLGCSCRPVVTTTYTTLTDLDKINKEFQEFFGKNTKLSRTELDEAEYAPNIEKIMPDPNNPNDYPI